MARLLEAESRATGELLPEWPYAPWAEAARRDVERVYTSVLAELAERLLATGQYRVALLRYERLLAIEPEREALHRS